MNIFSKKKANKATEFVKKKLKSYNNGSPVNGTQKFY